MNGIVGVFVNGSHLCMGIRMVYVFGVEYVAEMMMRDCIYPSISLIWLTATSEVDMFDELLTVMP